MSNIAWAIMVSGVLLALSVPPSITRLTDTAFVIAGPFGWKVCDIQAMTCKVPK